MHWSGRKPPARLIPFLLHTMPSHIPFRPHLLAAVCIIASAGALAQDSATHSYDIPAQALNTSLVRIASQGGVPISVDAELVRGLQAPAVRGSLTPEAAVRQAIAGTGLELARTGNGVLTLRRYAAPQAPAKAAPALPTVTVNARRASDGTTEGTGSYTSRITSIASKSDQALREVPQSVSVVTRQQIEDQALIDITDALLRVPGLTYNGTAFSSRGFAVTAMQMDGGAPLAIGDYSYTLQQDMAFYDRVEMMRGASGLLGGVGDPGGIINLARKKPLAERQVTASMSLGRWDNRRTELDVSTPLALDGRVRGRGVAVYQDTGSFMNHRGTEKAALYGVLEADLTPDTLLTLGASHGQVNNNGALQSLPRYSTGADLQLPRNANLSQPWAYDDTDNTEVFGGIEHQLANRWKIKLGFMHSSKKMDRIYNYTSGAVNPLTLAGPKWGAGKVRTETTQDVVDANLGGTFELAGRRHEFLVGADWQRVQGDWTNSNLAINYTLPVNAFDPGIWNPGMTASDYNYSARYAPWGQEQVGGYGVLRLHPTDRLHVILGARASKYEFTQHIETKRGDAAWTVLQDAKFNEPSKVTPYGGVIYDLDSHWSAYASYSSIFKPQPLVMAGPQPGTSLRPVTGKSYETGVKGELLDGRLNATFSVFNVERTGTAVVDPNYPTSSNANDGNCCYLPQGKVTSRGFDVELGGEAAPGWQLAAGYTFNSTKDETTQKVYSSVTPRHTLKLATAYTLPGDWSRWRVGGEMQLKSRHYVSGSALSDSGSSMAYDFVQPGYTLWNAMLQYRIDPTWTLTFNVQNLFDKVYYQALGSTSSNNVYGTPRNAMLTLRGRF